MKKLIKAIKNKRHGKTIACLGIVNTTSKLCLTWHEMNCKASWWPPVRHYYAQASRSRSCNFWRHQWEPVSWVWAPCFGPTPTCRSSSRGERALPLTALPGTRRRPLGRWYCCWCCCLLTPFLLGVKRKDKVRFGLIEKIMSALMCCKLPQ